MKPYYLSLLISICVFAEGRDDYDYPEDDAAEPKNLKEEDQFWGHPIDDADSQKDPSDGNDSNKMDESEKKQYLIELKAGDITQMFGNQHRYQPHNYRVNDLGRRFVLQYPYEEVKPNNDIEDEEDLSLIPKRAPPELVLAIANQSALIQAALPVDPNEYLLKKESLRTGNYWNSYWKEEVKDPVNILRSQKRSKLDTVAAKLSPGTPIYEYVSKLNKLYPKLLYVINKAQ